MILSCSHSGQGRIFKGDGVVGIARALLAAGAPSSEAVLVILWETGDKATMMFMKNFTIHQSMKSRCESDQCSEMRCWAPYQLIGDNLKSEFEGLMMSKNESSNKFFFSFVSKITEFSDCYGTITMCSGFVTQR